MSLKLPPPVLFMIGIGLITFLPRYNEPVCGWRFVAALFAIISFIIAGMSVYAFLQKKTTISPLDLDKTQVLVVHSVYKVSRNPMYLSLVGLLIAWGMWTASLSFVIVVWGFIRYLTYFQILPEERMLEQKFGQVYLSYQQQVRRWL
ncbi:hypothetical protein A4A71_07970 [Nicoletella semolina]|nr:isoprenylcysteine carboxylmethyltransferase family protein [Nicoletella semolina]MDH2925253.1 hypothetical protein [Nicoletella semolina]